MKYLIFCYDAIYHSISFLLIDRLDIHMIYGISWSLQGLSLPLDLTIIIIFRTSYFQQKMDIIDINQQVNDFAGINQIESIKLIEEEYEQRRQFRRHKIQTIKHKLQNSMFIRQRKSQSVIFYFLNLSIPIVLTCLNAYILLDLGVNSELKGKLIIAFCFIGFTISIISNLQIAPWREILKLYFLIDSLVPVFISGVIGFFAVFNYLSTGQWYEIGFEVCFPTFAFYFSGSLRVMIAYQKWQKWKVIIFKLSVLVSGLIFFYVGFVYMKGAYKITEGYLPAMEETVKNVVYLYVFGNCDLFFGFYRKISDFDQTNELKFEYQFKAKSEQNKKKLIESQMLDVQKQVMCQQLKDRVQTKIVSLYYKRSRFANNSINKNEMNLEL